MGNGSGSIRRQSPEVGGSPRRVGDPPRTVMYYVSDTGVVQLGSDIQTYQPVGAGWSCNTEKVSIGRSMELSNYTSTVVGEEHQQRRWLGDVRERWGVYDTTEYYSTVVGEHQQRRWLGDVRERWGVYDTTEYYSTVVGEHQQRRNNCVCAAVNPACSSQNVIVNGGSNRILQIQGNSVLNFIGNGGFNNICDSLNSFIGTGVQNCVISTDNSVILSGGQNRVYSRFSSIITGSTNTVSGNYSVISGGEQNSITAMHSIIGTGRLHEIGGCYSVIAGGCTNCIAGDFSAVLGGCMSCDNGFNYAGVFGQAVVAQAANTFHVECLNAVNSPAWNVLLPVGTLSFVNVTPGMIGVGFPIGARVAMIR